MIILASSKTLYADDVLIYRIIDSEDDCKMLHRDLDLLKTWVYAHVCSDKKHLIHSNNDPSIPRWRYLRQRHIWTTLSNALEKSTTLCQLVFQHPNSL